MSLERRTILDHCCSFYGFPVTLPKPNHLPSFAHFSEQGWVYVFLCSIIINGNWEHLRGAKPFPRDVILCIKILKHERIHIDT